MTNVLKFPARLREVPTAIAEDVAAFQAVHDALPSLPKFIIIEGVCDYDGEPEWKVCRHGRCVAGHLRQLRHGPCAVRCAARQEGVLMDLLGSLGFAAVMIYGLIGFILWVARGFK